MMTDYWKVWSIHRVTRSPSFLRTSGIRTLTTPGGTVAGELDLSSDGTFTFLPAEDFNGVVTFSAARDGSESAEP